MHSFWITLPGECISRTPYTLASKNNSMNIRHKHQLLSHCANFHSGNVDNEYLLFLSHALWLYVATSIVGQTSSSCLLSGVFKCTFARSSKRNSRRLLYIITWCCPQGFISTGCALTRRLGAQQNGLDWVTASCSVFTVCTQAHE